MTPGEVLAETTRRDVRTGDEVVESVHTGHLALVGPDGDLLAGLGDPDVATFARSTAKPFQATACLELVELSGGSPSAAEIAVAWSSHRAEPVQVEAVRRILRHGAIAPGELTCPPAPGEHDPGAVPAPILHNCSGKHALFALAGLRQGTDRDRLLDPDGPLQRVVLDLLAEVLGPPLAVGTDGCGAPAVVVPLRRIAHAYARLVEEDRFARVREAGLARPDLVGGEGRLETALLGAGVVAKPGAEGVFGVGWTGHDGRPRGLAVRAADGAYRATEAVVIELLAGLGVVGPATWTAPPVLGGGRPVGRVRVPDRLAGLVEAAPTAR